MELSAKNLNLITRAVKYLLCELHIRQMTAIKREALSSADTTIDVEYITSLEQEIADYTQLHKELKTCKTYIKYPLSD